MSDTLDPQATEPPAAPDDTPAPPASDAEPVPAPPAEPGPAAPDAIVPPLAALLASIRTAVAKGASTDARAAGAMACRSILTVLEAMPGQPLVPTAQPASPAPSIATLLKQPGFLSQLAAMSREQLLDLLKQFTGAAPTHSQNPTSGAPRFHLIQLPPARRPGGK